MNLDFISIGVINFLNSPFTSLVAAILNGLLAVVILSRNPHGLLNRIYALTAFSTCWWAAAEFMERSSGVAAQALAWERLASLGYVSTIFLQCWFAMHFSGVRAFNRRLLAAFLSFASLVSIFLVWTTNFIVLDVRNYSWGFASVPGQLFFFLLLLLGGELVLGLLLYLKGAISDKESLKRRQFYLLFVGFLIPTVIGMYTDGYLPLVGQGYHVELATLTTTINILIVAFAMVRYGFLGIGIEIAAPFVLATLADAVFIAGQKEKIVYANRSAQKLAGAEENVILGRAIKDFLPDLPPKAFTSFFNQESKFKSDDGKYIPVRVLAQRVADLTSGTRGNVFTLQDLTEIKKLQEVETRARADAEARHRGAALIQSAAEGIFSTDTAGNINLWNAAMVRLTGVEAKEILGKNISLGLRIIDRSEQYVSLHDSIFRKVFENKETVSISFLDGYFLRDKGNEKIAVSITASPLFYDGGELLGAVVVVGDETKAFEADRTKSEFISIASHQLRTPLSTIRWFSELLTGGDLGDLNFEQKDALVELDSAVGRMIVLVNMLLNVSRIEQGTLAVIPEPCDMVKLINDLVHELKYEAERRGLLVEVQIKGEMPSTIIADPKLMRFVVENLITNAMKYTPAKGNIKISISRRDQDIEINIADTGIGIPDDEQNKIFQKFFRATNAREKIQDGTGLGLFIAKFAVEASGGKIWFSSKKDKETIFSFTIPIKGSAPKEGLRQLT